MAIPITIPRLGWNMEEGIFLGWLKKDGEPVRAGETIFRLESEKATEDIECHDGGILRIAPKRARGWRHRSCRLRDRVSRGSGRGNADCRFQNAE